jgi:hypothetical protein
METQLTKVCFDCGEALSEFEKICGTIVCLPTERMLEYDPLITSGCERDLDTPIMIMDEPPPPKV